MECNVLFSHVKHYVLKIILDSLFEFKMKDKFERKMLNKLEKNFKFFFFYIYMNIVHTNKYNKKLQSPGALNIKETPGYNKKIM